MMMHLAIPTDFLLLGVIRFSLNHAAFINYERELNHSGRVFRVVSHRFRQIPVETGLLAFFLLMSML